MPGMFDFFIDEERRRRQFQDDGVHGKMSRVREMLDPTRSIPPAVAPPVAPIPEQAARPRLISNPVQSTDPYQTRIENQRAYTDSIRNWNDPNAPNYNPVQNAPGDKGILGRLGDILKQAVISAGAAYDTGQGSPTDRLLGAAGAGIAGGTYGGFHPQVDEERQRLQQIGQSERQEQILSQQRQGDMANRAQLQIMDDRQVDNDRQYKELIRKQILDEGRIKMWERRADQNDLKIVQTDDLLEMRNKWANSRDENDKRRLGLVEKELVVRERIGEKRNASEEKIAGIRADSSERIAGNRLTLDKAKFGQAKQQFEQVQQLRVQALNSKNEADRDKLEERITRMAQSATKAYQAGELDEAQYNELMGMIGITAQ